MRIPVSLVFSVLALLALPSMSGGNPERDPAFVHPDTEPTEQIESKHSSCRQRCLDDGEDPYDCDDYCILQAKMEFPRLPAARLSLQRQNLYPTVPQD